ncbi:MAG: choice-of-anchor D domain-containing protein [Acidobacteriota bacterium]|nr:choice-of-anchor D domain-containing protein [Acidobacteriota bacterium]
MPDRTSTAALPRISGQRFQAAVTQRPRLHSLPASVNFGSQTVGSTSAPQNITLSNTGSSYLAITSIAVTGSNSGDFLSSNTCGTIVASGATCTISVSFKPSLVAAEAASISIAGNEPGSPLSVGLAGTGAAAITSGGLVINPSATFAGENGTVTFTANRPVNWALANGSSGTLLSSNSTSATFSAPASIPAQNAVGSCQATPNDSVYNTRIDNLPVESHSATWTTNMGSVGIGFLTSWGTNIADSTTPVRNMSFYYTSPYNGPFVMPQWPALKRENGTFGTRLNDTDHHILTVRKGNCQFYEIYNDYFTPATCRDGVTQGCNAQSGLTYSWNSYALPTAGSTDAAGLPLGPLTLRLDEMKAGMIQHALRFTVAGGYIHASPYWPANSGNGCGNCVNSPPYGARFRLKASYNISRFSPGAQVVLTALKQYGMFLADAGTGPTVTVNTDVTEDPASMGVLGEIGGAQINMTNFEAVDESSFIVSNSSLRVNPANGFETPASFAVLTATDQTNSTYQVTFPIALQSVTVGIPSPTMAIMAGMSNYQLASWITGSSNQNTMWSMVSGVGSVTPGGAYTPPASVTGPTQAVLQVASAADSSASARLYVTVLPVGSNPAGTIRIDSGNPNGTTDSNGNVWLGTRPSSRAPTSSSAETIRIGLRSIAAPKDMFTKAPATLMETTSFIAWWFRMATIRFA